MPLVCTAVASKQGSAKLLPGEKYFWKLIFIRIEKTYLFLLKWNRFKFFLQEKK